MFQPPYVRKICLFVLFLFCFKTAIGQVVLNEVLPYPSGAQGMIPSGLEWIEVYNPTCNPVDISGWRVACRSNFGTGGAMAFPAGTIVPPLGFRVLGNGQGVVGPYCNTGNWVMQNLDGWIALYDASGTPLEGIFWTNSQSKINNSSDADFSPNPCNVGGGSLQSAYQINQLGLMTYVGNNPAAGTIYKRMPDAGPWQSGGAHTPLACNNPAICPTPITAAANASPATISCGQSSTLTATPAGLTYTWSTGQNSQSISVMPMMTTTYTVTITGGPCPGGSTATVTVTVGNCCEAEAGTISVSNKCPGENFTATASGFNATAPYTQTYFLTNSAGQILQVSSTGNFTAPATCGTYTVHSYNYLTGGPGITVPVVGANVSGINCNPPSPCCDRQPATFTVAATVTMPPNGASVVACPALAVQPTPPVVNNSCGTALSSAGPQVTGNPVCSGYKTYSWTYTDACNGTTYVWEHNYFVSPPVVSMPANQGSTVACPSAATAPTPPAVNDNCGRALSVTGPVVNPATVNCSGTQTYTWTYTDCAGNTFPWVYTYTISPPVVSMPANTSSNVACLSAIVAPTPPSVTDNCGRLLNVTGPSISGPDCSGNKVYQYTYTDCSSNTYFWTHTFVIAIPTVTMPPPEGSTVNCASAATTPTSPNVTDNCGNPLTKTGPVVGTTPVCGGSKTYTWTYTDCAGNTYSWVYTYTINPPVAGTIPPNGSSTVPCVSNAMTVPTPPVVNDNCGTPMAVSGPVVSPNPVCSGTKTYTWTYTDCSGNATPWSYVYTISPPTFNMPPNGGSTVNCLAAAQTVPSNPSVSNSCGTPLAVTGPVVGSDPACSGAKTYTWTYTDCTGTNAQWVYTYNISDPIISISCPAAQSFCQVPSNIYTIPAASASSNCGGSVNVSFNITGATTRTGTGSDASGIFNPGVSAITWVTTNTCGNTASCQTTVTITPTPQLSLVSATCNMSLTLYTVVFTSTGGNISVLPAGTVAGSSITNIPAGTNIVITANDNGCTATLPVTAPNCSCPTIAAPTGSGYSICAGQAIQPFNAAAGSGYQVNWYTTSTGGTPVLSNSNTFTPAGPGTWYAEAFDPVTSCSSLTRTSFTLVVNALPLPAITGVNTLCTGNPLTLTASGGTSYVWSNGGGSASSATFSSLAAGSYTFTVTVTDANGCSASTQHAAVVSEQPVISGISTGCAPDLKTFSITYASTGGNVTSSHGTVGAGMITGIDTSVQVVTITVTNPANPSCTVTQNVPRPNCQCPNIQPPSGQPASMCAGSTVPLLTATASGGFQINWYSAFSGGIPLSANSGTYQPSPAPGMTTTYYAAAYDPVTKCESNRIALVLTVNPVPTVNVVSDITVCGGDAIPAITFSGGQAGTVYNWTNTNTATGLSASGSGNIASFTGQNVSSRQVSTVSVTPVLGTCTGSSQAFKITVDQKPTLQIDSVRCTADLLKYNIFVKSTGGTLSATAGSVLANSITDIPKATSPVTVTCTNTQNASCLASATVPAPNCDCPVIPAPTGIDTRICQGQPIPAFTATAQAGLQIYWYAAPTGGTPLSTNSSTYLPTSAGTYYAEAVDVTKGCRSVRKPFKLTIDPLPSVTLTGDFRICKGASTTLTAGGGNSYIWSTGQTSSGITASGLSASTTYTVTVTDANLCSDKKSQLVQVDALPVLTVTTDCGAGKDSGIINTTGTTAAGGTLSYTINGNPDADGDLTAAVNGPYIITITEQPSGCQADTTVNINCGCAPVIVTVAGNALKICQGSSLDFSQAGGQPGGVWSLNPATAGTINASGKFVSGAQFNGKVKAVYSSAGCSGELEIEVINNITAEVLATDPLCPGQANGRLELSGLAGGDVLKTFKLNDIVTQFPVTNLQAGNYNIIITDVVGCSFSKSVTLISPQEWDIVSLTSDKNNVLVRQDVNIVAQLNLAQANIGSIVWTPDLYLSCDDCLDPVAKPEASTLYTLTVKDKNGCTRNKSILISIRRDDKVDIANIFSPDGKNGNNIFYIIANPESVTQIEKMVIFDRWGNTIFDKSNISINDPVEGWDGTYHGSNAEQGVYVYYVVLKMIDGTSVHYKGDITLMR